MVTPKSVVELAGSGLKRTSVAVDVAQNLYIG